MKKSKKPDFFVWLRSGLRNLSRRHSPIYEALAASKQPYNGSNPRQRFAYQCAHCKLMWAAKEVSVDHILDCGSLMRWEDVKGFMERLFCGREGLQVLCSECHDIKTYMARYNVDEQEARLFKDLAFIMKQKSGDILMFIDSYIDGADCSNAVKRKKLVEGILRSIT